MLAEPATNDTATGFAYLLIILAFYMIPTIIAVIRKVPNIGSVVVINLLLGWTFIGWVVALAMSVRSVPPPTYAPPGVPPPAIPRRPDPPP